MKNLRLISSEDPSFRKYTSSFKNVGKTGKEKTKSEMISHVLELATREWINNSITLFDKRIIAYDVFNNKFKKQETRFDEIDYVIKKGNDLIIGEVKSSYDEMKVISKASSQLIRKSNFLRKMGFNVRLQIIHFDLCFDESKRALHRFNEKFTLDEFSISKRNEVEFEYLHLSPIGIYDWGVRNGIIKTPELLYAAIAEAKKNFEGKVIKSDEKIKNMGKNGLYKPNNLVSGKISNSTQGLCKKSETAPTNSEITKVVKKLEKENLGDDTIVIARYNWLLNNNFIIPDSNRLMNLIVQIKDKVAKRAFYSENPRELFKKLNYKIIVLN